MPRAFDRRKQTVSDHDPLRNLQNFEDIDTTTKQAGGLIGALLSGLTQGITDLATSIANAVSGGVAVVGGIFGSVIQTAFDAIFGVHTSAGDAQTTANDANSAIAELKASLDAGTSGAKIIDTFTRPEATDLGADWEQNYDSGTGTFGTNGNGVAVWEIDGNDDQLCDCRHLTPLTSNVQIIRTIFDDHIANQNNLDPTFSIYGRSDATRLNRVLALIDYNSCEIGIVLAGVYTRLGSSVSVSSKAGDLWELRLGRDDGTDDYEFTLLQNNNPRVNQTDSGALSHIGPLYMFTGMIPKCGLRNNFGVLFQARSANVRTFTATDNSP